MKVWVLSTYFYDGCVMVFTSEEVARKHYDEVSDSEEWYLEEVEVTEE